jgi:hypothetical protein
MVGERCYGADPGVRMGIGLCLDLNLRLSLSACQAHRGDHRCRGTSSLDGG